MTTLMKRVEEAGADIRCDARLIGLVQDRDGRVRGGVARIGDDEAFIEARREAGLPEGALQSTVALYNEHDSRGADPLFHKAPQWLTPLDQPPYALVSYELDKIVPAAFTLGGLDTLPTGEVVTPRSERHPGPLRRGPHRSGNPPHLQGLRERNVGGRCNLLRKAGGKVRSAPIRNLGPARPIGLACSHRPH